MIRVLRFRLYVYAAALGALGLLALLFWLFGHAWDSLVWATANATLTICFFECILAALELAEEPERRGGRKRRQLPPDEDEP